MVSTCDLYGSRKWLPAHSHVGTIYVYVSVLEGLACQFETYCGVYTLTLETQGRSCMQALRD